MYRHIRDLREDRDLTQSELAREIGVRQQTYSDYERGRLDIPTTALIKLSKFYGVSIDYLLASSDGNGGSRRAKSSRVSSPYERVLSEIRKMSRDDRLKIAESLASSLKEKK